MAPKENDTIKGIKSVAFDWIFKALIGVVLFLVKDMHSDVKMMMQTIPAMKAEIENLKDKNLIDRFRWMKDPSPAKQEELITYDSLKSKQ